MLGDEPCEIYLLRVLESIARPALSADIWAKYQLVKSVHPPRRDATNFIIEFIQSFFNVLEQENEQFPSSLFKLMSVSIDPRQHDKLIRIYKQFKRYLQALRQDFQLTSANRQSRSKDQHDKQLQYWRQRCTDLEVRCEKLTNQLDGKQIQLFNSTKLNEQREEQWLQLKQQQAKFILQIERLHSQQAQEAYRLKTELKKQLDSYQYEQHQGLLDEIQKLRQDLDSQTKVITGLYAAYVRPCSQLVQQFKEYGRVVQGSNMIFLTNLLRKLQEHNQLLSSKVDDL